MMRDDRGEGMTRVTNDDLEDTHKAKSAVDTEKVEDIQIQNDHYHLLDDAETRGLSLHLRNDEKTVPAVDDPEVVHQTRIVEDLEVEHLIHIASHGLNTPTLTVHLPIPPQMQMLAPLN